MGKMVRSTHKCYNAIRLSPSPRPPVPPLPARLCMLEYQACSSSAGPYLTWRSRWIIPSASTTTVSGRQPLPFSISSRVTAGARYVARALHINGCDNGCLVDTLALRLPCHCVQWLLGVDTTTLRVDKLATIHVTRVTTRMLFVSQHWLSVQQMYSGYTTRG